MSLWLRLWKVIFLSFFRPRMDVFDESVLTFLVWPDDLDTNIHMNNARYVAIMDHGRWDLVLRSGLRRLVFKERCAPIIASIMVRYRRSLKPFDRFTLRTKGIGWDDKWLFIEHRIECRGELMCLGIVKAAFIAPEGRLTSAQLAARLNYTKPSPELPPWVAGWVAAEDAQNKAAVESGNS